MLAHRWPPRKFLNGQRPGGRAYVIGEAGLRTVLVPTGVTSRSMVDRFPYRPSRIVDSIADLVAEVRVSEVSVGGAPVSGA